MIRKWGSEGEEDKTVGKSKHEVTGSQETWRTSHLESKEDLWEPDGTWRRSGSKSKLEETDDLKHTWPEGHPKPVSLQTKYLDSPSCFILYACAHHVPAALSALCSANLSNLFLPQGLCTCYSIPLACLPSPIPYYMIGLFAIRSQTHVTFVYPFWSSPQPVTLLLIYYPVLVSLQHSTLAEIIFFVVVDWLRAWVLWLECKHYRSRTFFLFYWSLQP